MIKHAAAVFAACLVVGCVPQAADKAPLPSWTDGPRKQALLDLVARVTKVGGPDYVPPSERIAVFDNDGTLWCEQPMYVQVTFALDRVRALAPMHPEWKDKPPFKAVLANDPKALEIAGPAGLVELILATHTGMTAEQFERDVRDWLATARHPRFKRPYTELVYQPMLEVLAHLRQNGFKTFIVSGGEVDFMRPWTEKAYGVPPEQVVGSRIKTKYEVENGKPRLMRLPEVAFNDDKAGKPVGIHEAIGRRPILAFGNSDGDYEMLQYTTTGKGPRLGLLVHHTDAEREYAYDRKSQVGRLDKGLTDAKANGWHVVDMKADWTCVFPPPR